jgi:hypothetical protein
MQRGFEPDLESVNQRPSLRRPDLTALVGGAAADHSLDGVELADPAQSLGRERTPPHRTETLRRQYGAFPSR